MCQQSFGSMPDLYLQFVVRAWHALVLMQFQLNRMKPYPIFESLGIKKLKGR